MNPLKSSSTWAVVSLLALSVLAIAGSAFGADAGRVLWVANDGVDSTSCGMSRTTQCRSITQAIQNAANGDTIQVGAGRYGDLNGDRDFADAGEEHANSTLGCIVCITKSVRIFSLNGATITMIDAAADNPELKVGVAILANGVTFGVKDHGFLITGAQADGLLVYKANGARVGGNLALKNGGSGFRGEDVGDSLLIADNTAMDNQHGFQVEASDPLANDNDVMLKRNIAIANSFVGFIGFRRNAVLFGDVATGNYLGFALDEARFSLLESTAVGNTSSGITTSNGPCCTFFGFKSRRDTIVGNQGPGIEIGVFSSGSDIQESNLYGNNTIAVTDEHGEQHLNCGVYNIDKHADVDVSATGNFWGRATGPGADPADEAGGGSVGRTNCDVENTTIVKPFSPTPFGITH
ncbi:MAG: hypothetical protein ACJ8R9_17810 [Steroidobacteraceae bacterium]